MTAWRKADFADVVESKGSGASGLPQSEWASEGKYPVIGQGARYIEGWTDRRDLVISPDPALVLYGGHSRRAKLVDQPFVPGPNVRILRPLPGLSAAFLYRYLEQLTIENRGYADHFPDVRRKGVPLPPLVQQERIAWVLDRVDALRAKRAASMAIVDALEQAVFIQMFGDPIRNERAWPTRRLIDIVDPRRGISYGVVQRGVDEEGGVSLVRISDIVDGVVSTAALKRTSLDTASKYRRTILRGGELIISIRGTVGRCAVIPAELSGGNITRELALIPHLERSHTAYLLALLRTESVQRRLQKNVKGIAQSGINLEDLRDLPIILPPKVELDAFNHKSRAVGQLKTRLMASLANAETLRASVQSLAFAGQL